MKSLGLLVCLSLSVSALAADIVPHGLVAERLPNPVGIDVARPRLSWKAPEGVVRQTAYEIEADGRSCGRIEGADQIDVAWPGAPLTTGSRHAWRVRLWNEQGRATGWSAPATFVAGVMNADDWQAKWIGPNAETRPEIDFGAAEWIAAEDGKYRTELTLETVPDILEMIFLSRTRYQLFVNGKKSRWSYEGHILRLNSPRIADLTAELKPGRNTVELVAPKGDDGTPSAVIGLFRENAARTFGGSDASWGRGKTLGRLRDVAWGREADLREELASPAFVKRFAVAKDVRKTTLFITGLGYYEASLNGRRIGDKLLDPSPTDYSKRVLYSTYVLDGALKKGENEMRVLLGHGFYDGRVRDTWNFDMAPWRNFPRMIARLEIEYVDGTREAVVTDGSWRQVKSPVGWDDIREGEIIGGGHVREPAFPLDGFPAAEVAGPGGVLTGASHPATRIVREFRPSGVYPVDGEPCAYVIEFPANVAGWARLRFRGLKKGDVVAVRYDERVDRGMRPAAASDNGNVDTFKAVNGPEPRRLDCHFKGASSQAFCRKWAGFQTDRFISSGLPEETYEPRFTYNGFKYVYVRGLRTPLRAEDAVQCFVSTDFPETGTFASSNPILDKLVAAAAQSYRCNFTESFPTDCPHREKNGWTDDSSMASAFGMIRFDNDASYAKWMRDFVDAQTEEGDFPGIVPTSGWGYYWGNGPMSDSALSVIPWNLYLYRADRASLETIYPTLVKYLKFTETKADADGLVAHGLGDWVPVDWKVVPSVRFVASCFHLQANRIASKIAAVLGRTDDSAAYAKRADGMRAAMRRVFRGENGRFDDGRQTAQACAIMFDLVEPDELKAVGDRLVEAVHAKNDHTETGLVGTKTLYRALTKIGRADLALKVLTQPEAPSPAAWICRGSDTLWEDWGEGASRNHIMFGDFAAWAYEGLAGIRPTSPGYRTFEIAPAYGCGLTQLKASVETRYGRLALDWAKDERLAVTVPPCTTARVTLPDGTVRSLGPGVHDLFGVKDPVSFVNTGIGSVSHMLVPTFRTVQRPHALFRFNGPAGQFTEDRISDLWLQNPGHRDSPVFSVRPLNGGADESSGPWFATWDQEHATPYSYDLYLDSCGVKLSVAPGEKTAIVIFAFERKGEHALSFGTRDKMGAYAFDGGLLTGTDVFHGLRGCAAKVYLAAEFDVKPADVGTAQGRTTLRFGTAPETVRMRLGLSCISVEQAKRNLRAEIADWDAAALLSDARKSWNDVLGQVEVEGGTDDERRVFYTALWRCHERMVNVTEQGRYYGFDGKVHETGGVDYYTDDWIWDTFRAAHPLMTILNPKEESDKLASYVRMGEQDPDHWMPVFPSVAGDRHSMVNRHYTIMFLDAWRKGIRGFDAQKAFKLMDHTEETESLIPWHRGPLTELDRFYKTNGYYPGIRPDEKEWVKEVQTDWERRQCVSVTQGASYDAWALAEFGREIGIAADRLAKYDERAKGYRKLWNAKTQFFHPKDRDGKFIEPFDYMICGGYGARNYFTENNAWTYIWDVQHDLAGLCDLFGGAPAMEAKLDAMLNASVGAKWRFTADMPDGCTGLMGVFTMANEPAFHIPYLYTVCGRPDKTQKFVRKTLESWFRNDRMGMCGDEDGGGMSAYAVFSMMGFYPVTPGKPEYVWGSPVFRKVTIHLQNGRDFTLLAPNASRDAKYVRGITVDGKATDVLTPLAHADILRGATVVVEMVDRPFKEEKR